jgi:glycosyltransferase involved in cell wall biosynthesis
MAARIVSARIARNRAVLRAGELLVAREAALRRDLGAVRHAVAVARFASQQHPGRFVSRSLESSLQTVGGRAVRSASHPRTGPRAGSVLHVATRHVALGGHTRWIRRVIDADRSRSHSVVTTGSSQSAAPPELAATVARSGGTLTDLGVAGEVFERTEHLRRLATEHDLVVLSTDPADAVPSLAFDQRAGGPPIARLNHSDHIFWLGAEITDLLVDFRPVGARISAERRGFPADRIRVLPLPVDVPARLERREARALLDIPEESLVLLSVGAPYKFRPFGSPRSLGYLDLVVPLLDELEYVCVITVGPEADGRFAGEAERFGGRLRLHGPTPSLAPYFAAADAFLNSFPIGSDTTMWEAAATGLPVITMLPEESGLELMRGDPEEFQGLAIAPGDAAELAAAVRRLRDSPEWAADLGARLRDLVLDERLGGQWTQALDAILDQAVQMAPMSPQDLCPSEVLGPVDRYVSSWSSGRSLSEAALRRLGRGSRGRRSSESSSTAGGIPRASEQRKS